MHALQHITEIRGLFRVTKEILRILKPSDKAILLECITDMRSDRNVISLPRSAWVKIIEKTGGKIETAEKLDYSRKDEKAGILSSALRRKKQLM